MDSFEPVVPRNRDRGREGEREGKETEKERESESGPCLKVEVIVCLFYPEPPVRRSSDSTVEEPFCAHEKNAASALPCVSNEFTWRPSV